MEEENKKEFSSKYTLDYKTYKEFSKGYIATKKSSIVMLFVVLVLLILYMFYRDYETVILFGSLFLIFAFLIIVTGRNKLQYKRYKSLNNNEDLDANIKIGKEKIISTSKKGDTSNYEFSQIVGIIETKNLVILKLEYNMGIIIDKNTLEGGTKEELIEYLFSVCKNLKKKKVIKSKKWLVFRNIMFALMAITFILAIILSVLSHYQMDKYIEALQQSGYEIEMQESVYSRKSS